MATSEQIVTDVLGREITAGCTIVYAANGGRRETLRKAIVVRIDYRELPRVGRGTGLAPCIIAQADAFTRKVVLRDPLRVVVIAEDAATSWLRHQLQSLNNEPEGRS